MNRNPILVQPPVLYPDFGPYLTYVEAVKSATAVRAGINNTPTQQQYTNMVLVYHHILVPLFDRFGKLPIRSFFRCPALNRAEGGSATSAHLAGLAVDIDCDSMRTVNNRQVYDWARQHLDAEQVKLHRAKEYLNPVWVHIAYRNHETNQLLTTNRL